MELREWVLRHVPPGTPGRAPRAPEDAPRTRYGGHQGPAALDPAVPGVCDGTACRFAGGEALRERLARHVAVGEVRCLGRCYDAPAMRAGGAVHSSSSSVAFRAWLDAPAGDPPAEEPAAIPRMSLADPPVLLRDLLGPAHLGIAAEYDLPEADEILEDLESYGLTGRRGDAAAAVSRWLAARDAQAPDRVVVANGDDGEPGSFVDRLLLEEAPHAVLSGMMCCALAIGARTGVAYVRAELPRAARMLIEARDAARAAGNLGGDFDVEVVAGSAPYVCGEEGALLNAIEGLPGDPRLSPSSAAPTLWGLPAVVQNVESLAMLSWRVRSGRRDATQLVGLAGAVDWPGVVEVPIGTPLRRVLMEGGGGEPAGRRWSMALVGGPFGRVLPEPRFDVPLAFETLPGVRHGGIVVFDRAVTPGALARHLFRFARNGSCGLCAACGEGTPRLAEQQDRAGLERLLDTLEGESRCGFGRHVPRPVRDLLEHFGDEVFA